MSTRFQRAALAATLAGFSLSATASGVLGSMLQQQLTTMSATDKTMVVVTYDQLEPVSNSQVQQVLELGVANGVQFQSLPIMGALATPSQIQQLVARDDVRSVFLNRDLQYFNAQARQITGVERLQSDEFINLNGHTYTGNGVTIMVNDSGIDATHDDLKLGSKVVENVQAATNAQAGRSILPIFPEGLWLEGQPNSDLNVGHGTHCAGTIAGTGANSNKLHKGAAPDADLIGYGSGAGLSILDALGGYDYAISHIWDFNSPIKVMSNSWGSSGKYEPNGPISVASYKAYKLGILSVFAAGNSGSGEDTHNPYAQIPWGMSVGAGDKMAKLAGFSSRGKRGETADFSMPDGSQWTYNNEVSIVAPGVDIISTRAKTNIVSNGGADDLDAMPAELVPYYTMISGTSMATPHVAGIAALMLEANPSLTPLDIKRLMQETATNMPGYETWEVGAGYVNAHSAVAAALNEKMAYSATVNNLKSFNANAILNVSDQVEPFEVLFSPIGEPETHEFYVGDDAAWVLASSESMANLVKLKLEAPDGTVYFGNLTLPVLDTDMRVSAPAQTGTWKISAYGITSLSGVQADPTGTSNGPGLPEFISGEINFLLSGGYEGVDDIAGHPVQGAIEYAISERLMDGYSSGKFRPNSRLKRRELAQYLVMGGAARQYRAMINEPEATLVNVSSVMEPYVQSVSAIGGALKDRAQQQGPLMQSSGGDFDPNGSVNKVELAYSLVQSLGLAGDAQAFDASQDITVDYQGQKIVLDDQASIPANMKGYVQVALDLSLLGVRWSLEQGPYDLYPTWVAHYEPTHKITRAEYAVVGGRFMDAYYR